MISSDSFLISFRSIFEETLGDQILMSTHFQDLEEWSSLMLLSLIVLFEEEYKTKLTPQEIDRATTVNDLYLLLGKNKVK